MAYVVVGISLLTVLGFIIEMIRLWRSQGRTKKIKLNGMSEKAYALTQMTRDDFIAIYSEEEYYRSRTELESLKHKKK